MIVSWHIALPVLRTRFRWVEYGRGAGVTMDSRVSVF